MNLLPQLRMSYLKIKLCYTRVIIFVGQKAYYVHLYNNTVNFIYQTFINGHTTLR